MKVKDLIAYLLDFDMNLEVIVASDPEGNKFSMADDAFTEGNFDDGEFWGAGEDDDVDDPNALVIWPTR